MIDRNQIPASWEMVKLDEVCEIFQGYGFPTSMQGKSEGKFPFYKVGDISRNVQAGNLYLEICENYIDDEELQKLKAKPYPKNTVVFAKIGEALKLNRRVLTKHSCIVDNNAIGLKAIETICSDLFLFFFLKRIKLEKYSRATTVPSVRKSDIEKLEIPLPPLPEQHRIVSKIEELFSELDKGIESLKTARQQLKIYRQAVLKWAFEGRLTHENVKEGELPEGWKWVKISEVATTFGGYAFKSSDFMDKGKYQVLRMGNVRPGVLRFWESPVFVNNVDERVLSRSLLKVNDVIITQTGTKNKRDYGFTVLITKSNLLLNQRIAAIRFKDNYLPKFFLYFSWTNIFKDQFFANETGNVGQGNVGMNAITEARIPFCEVEKQHAVVDKIETRLSVCDKLEETITTTLQQNAALRQSILKKAFEGKLVAQNPEDEPAAKVLESIKAEKAAEQRYVYRKGKPSTKQSSVGAK